jgi:transposase
MRLSLMIYGYATGTFSSRAIERATYTNVALRFLAGDTHPDRRGRRRGSTPDN